MFAFLSKAKIMAVFFSKCAKISQVHFNFVCKTLQHVILIIIIIIILLYYISFCQFSFKCLLSIQSNLLITNQQKQRQGQMYSWSAAVFLVLAFCLYLSLSLSLSRSLLIIIKHLYT